MSALVQSDRLNSDSSAFWQLEGQGCCQFNLQLRRDKKPLTRDNRVGIVSVWWSLMGLY
jgi:hypothetical protein